MGIVTVLHHQVVYSKDEALEVLGDPADSGFAAGGNSSIRIPLSVSTFLPAELK